MEGGSGKVEGFYVTMGAKKEWSGKVEGFYVTEGAKKGVER
jgi:hypothetical protein